MTSNTATNQTQEDNRKVAAELVANFAMPVQFRGRTKRADFMDNIKNVLAGAGRQSLDYLQDPQNSAARNALVGAGVGGTASLLGSTGGRRISDTLRGAALGGAVGGAGTLAYQGLRGAKTNLSTPAIPEDIKQQVSEPSTSMIGGWEVLRPATGSAALGTGAHLYAKRREALKGGETLSRRLSETPLLSLYTGRNSKFPMPGEDVSAIKQKKIMDEFAGQMERHQRPSSFLSKITGKANPTPLPNDIAAWKEIAAKDPDGAFKLLQQGVEDMQKGRSVTPEYQPPPPPPPPKPTRESRREALGKMVDERLAEREQLAKAKAGPQKSFSPDVNQGASGSPATAASVKADTPRFEKLKAQLAEHLDDTKQVDAFKKIQPRSFDSINKPTRMAAPGRRRSLMYGLGALTGGVVAEPALWRLATSASNLVSRPGGLTPEEINQRVMEYERARSQG